MIEQELINTYSKLDINEKRNSLSSELERLEMLLDEVHTKYGIEKLPSSKFFYNKSTDANMSNDEYFDKLYERVVFLRKDILTLVNALMKIEQ